MDEAAIAPWWERVGHRPDAARAEERSPRLREDGPTEYAFTPRETFPVPAAERQGRRNGGRDRGSRAGTMSDSKHTSEEHAHDPEVLQLAAKVFDLARQGHAQTLAAYVDAGVPADLTNDRGDTLVMLAAYHGHAAAVTALLERGADPNRANDRGQTPLAGAVFKGEDEVVRALLDGGADPAAGRPSAVETARMLARAELLKLFGES
ncbi:hypothetical protein GCM10012280_26320 [Wenjunlia tyrosinilytica]|uniref:DUF3291 domain-containing protein n=2 Tax=Wenjunlia tyrosinilytica TaxID=1544741 RepID=A0A917ZP30_9ACTN|nr:hypothetical protein GCM10012280_26320 [Wenjunlia tyrosinilytica]